MSVKSVWEHGNLDNTWNRAMDVVWHFYWNWDSTLKLLFNITYVRTDKRTSERTHQNEKKGKPNFIWFAVYTFNECQLSNQTDERVWVRESVASDTWCKIDCWRRTEDDTGMLCAADSTNFDARMCMNGFFFSFVFILVCCVLWERHRVCKIIVRT